MSYECLRSTLPLTTSALKTVYHRRFIIKCLLFVYSAFIGLWLHDKELIGLVFEACSVPLWKVLSWKWFSHREKIQFYPRPCFVALANWNKFLLIGSLLIKCKQSNLSWKCCYFWKQAKQAGFADNRVWISISRQFPRTKATQTRTIRLKNQLTAEANWSFHFIVIQLNYLQLKSITHRRKCRKRFAF